MKIIIDKYVPYLQKALASFADVVPVEPEAITPALVQDADALIIRTRTQCNEALLHDSKVQFIATATIGFDHIDTAYCVAHHIAWTNCPGCNAQGVADYVETAFNVLCSLSFVQHPITIGIVGVGHVGSKVQAMAAKKGWRILLSDPPREERGEIIGTSLHQIAQEADIITFHTPLTHEGAYSTYHLADEAFFQALQPHAVVINAARGGVIDEAAWLSFLQNHPQSQAVVDCWENEPIINHALLECAAIATYHIAGYTLDGKFNASHMCLEALCDHFQIADISRQNALHLLQMQREISMQPAVGFDIEATSKALKASPVSFETLRKRYPLR